MVDIHVIIAVQQGARAEKPGSKEPGMEQRQPAAAANGIVMAPHRRLINRV